MPYNEFVQRQVRFNTHGDLHDNMINSTVKPYKYKLGALKNPFVCKMNEYSIKPSFNKTGLDQVVNEVCLALTAHKNGEYRPSGTAIIIAKGLAITAKHVLEDFLKYFDDIRVNGTGLSLEGSFNLLAFNIQANGTKGIVFNVTKLWISPISDIAILKLSVHKTSTDVKLPRSVTVDFNIPSPGDRICGFGYPRPSINAEKNKILWTTDPRTTTGEIIEVFPQGRDSSMINFPCFRTNARFDPSMSGGPIINKSGCVCGLICSSMPPDEDDGEHVSYVCALWPMVNIEIDVKRSDKSIEGTYPIMELVNNGFIDSEGCEKIVFETDSSGKTIRFGYRY